MLQLLSAASSLLGAGGANPLNAATPADGPQTSQATATATATQTTGAFSVGGGTSPLVIGLVILAIVVILKEVR